MTSWSPLDIGRFLDQEMYRLDGPAQWLGTEPNAVRKDWDTAAVRMCLAASWPYEQAAGNQSIPAVYKAVNLHERYLCDRAYLPATPRDMKIFTKAGVPAFGIESRHQLADFDVIGTSISYIVLLVNWVKLLQQSGIPVRWQDREPERWPMVMTGGQAYCNPEAMAPVADCVFLGEAEDEAGNGGIGQVLRMIEMFKDEGSWGEDRIGCYARLARTFNYLYFPRFVGLAYGDVGGVDGASQHVTGYSGVVEGMRLPLRKRHVRDLDKIEPLDDPPLLFTDPSMGSGDIEASRGCPAWCSFCRLTFAQKPFRQRSVEYMTSFGRQLQANVGGVELSPFGPDFPFQTNKNQLLRSLLEGVTDRIDSVAQRIDDFISDDTYLMLQTAGGATSVTLGLEGVSQRMRDLVGKATSESEVREAVTRGIRAGFRKFKLFMIVGLPGEDHDDIDRIVQMGRDLAAIRDSLAADKVIIQFSFTPLLYEAQTPFQWFSCWPVPDHALIGALEELRQLRILTKIGTKAEPNKVHFFQLCQRASRLAGEAIVDVLCELEQGCWGGVPRDMITRLESALKHRGFAGGMADLFGERGYTDMLGWEFIDTGISRDLLWSVYAQMREFAARTDGASYDAMFDGRYHGQEWLVRCDEACMGNSCGVCNRKDLELRRGYLQAAEADRLVRPTAVRKVDQSTVAIRIRARLTRPREFRWADNGFARHLLRRAGYRAQEALDGAAPCVSKTLIRFASDAHAWRDWTCGADYVEFGLTQRIRRLNGDEGKYMTILANELRPWVIMTRWTPYPAAVSMRSAEGYSLWQLEIDDDPALMRGRLADWDLSEYVPLNLHSEGAYFAGYSEEVNGKGLVDELWLARDRNRLLLKMLARRRAGPYQVYAALRGKASIIGATAHPAMCLDVFTGREDGTLDGTWCVRCAQLIPVSLDGREWDAEYCPRCADEVAGLVLAGTGHEEVVT